MSDVKMMLIANKADIKENRKITMHQGKQVLSYSQVYYACNVL